MPAVNYLFKGKINPGFPRQAFIGIQLHRMETNSGLQNVHWLLLKSTCYLISILHRSSSSRLLQYSSFCICFLIFSSWIFLARMLGFTSTCKSGFTFFCCREGEFSFYFHVRFIPCGQIQLFSPRQSKNCNAVRDTILHIKKTL